MKQLYDADYIIRKNNEYEELRLYYSPAEVKLRKLIEEANLKCEIQKEKYRKQKEKLMAKRNEKAEEEREM